MKLMDLFSFLPLSIQQKLAHIYIDRQLKKKVTINIKGQQHLDSISSPCIFIANHLSNLDGIVLMRLLKKKFDPHFVAGVKLSDDKFTNFFKTLIKTIDIKQNSAISIDEKGVAATAFTQIDYCGAAQPDGKAEMILNRPFIFAITGVDGSPLFIGIINNPNIE